MRISQPASPATDDCHVIDATSGPVTQLVFLNGQLMRENVDYRFDSEKHIHFLRKLSKSEQQQVVTIIDHPCHVTHISFTV